VADANQDITGLLRAWSAGDLEARDRAMALVHEAYLRLADQQDTRWQNRAQFLAVVSQMMRAFSSINIDPPGSLNAALLDINPRGDIIGRYQQPAGVFHTFMFSDGEFTSYDVPGALSNGGMGARASVNPKGEVVSIPDLPVKWIAGTVLESGHGRQGGLRRRSDACGLVFGCVR
jgi:ECF sigma factor